MTVVPTPAGHIWHRDSRECGWNEVTQCHLERGRQVVVAAVHLLCVDQQKWTTGDMLTVQAVLTCQVWKTQGKKFNMTGFGEWKRIETIPLQLDWGCW